MSTVMMVPKPARSDAHTAQLSLVCLLTFDCPARGCGHVAFLPDWFIVPGHRTVCERCGTAFFTVPPKKGALP